MIFAPTHPLCHMAYECGAVAHKKGFFVSLVQKQFCVFGDSFCLAYVMHFAPGPFAAGSTWFFLQPGRTVRNRSSSFLEEPFFIAFFAKKREGLRLSFRFFQAASLSSSLSASRTRSSRARVFFSLIFHRQT